VTGKPLQPGDHVWVRGVFRGYTIGDKYGLVRFRSKTDEYEGHVVMENVKLDTEWRPYWWPLKEGDLVKMPTGEIAQCYRDACGVLVLEWMNGPTGTASGERRRFSMSVDAMLTDSAYGGEKLVMRDGEVWTEGDG